MTPGATAQLRALEGVGRMGLDTPAMDDASMCSPTSASAQRRELLDAGLIVLVANHGNRGRWYLAACYAVDVPPSRIVNVEEAWRTP